MGIRQGDVDPDTWLKILAAAGTTTGPVAAPEPEAPSPLVAACWGGVGDSGLEATVPLRTASEANARGWQGKSRRTHAARLAVAKVLGGATGGSGRWPPTTTRAGRSTWC